MISLSLGARIDAKRRSRGKPGGADDTGGKRAPSLIAPPGLEGSGRIGETLSLLPGRWEGLPVPVLSVRWQRDGRDIPGATGFAYVPVPQDDGAEIAARVIAGNTAGTASAASPARRVIWPAPEVRAPIADQFLNPDSGEHVLNVSSNFEGGALRFSVTGEGVSIDPETGILSIATDALRDGISVTVTAVNSGGAVAQSFRLDVALPEIALPVAPEMVVAPVLPEVAAIGSKISVEAGTWSGTPVPELTYQWLLDGVEIAGAVEVSYLPLASEDGNLLACRVTASNSAGTAQAVSSAAEVRHATPLAAGGLADLLLDAGSGPVTVAAGAEFSGENLVFSVTGAGVEIDSTTGLVTISTDDLRTEEAITVTAGNSGGSATSSFRVTVRPVAPVLRVAPSLDGTGVIGAPVAVEPGLWDGAPEPALSFRWICGGDVVAGATEAAYVPGLAEDGKDLVCEVTATNEGGSEIARTPALALVLPAPVVAGTLADVSAEQGTPALELDAAAAFSGDGLVFAVAGDGAGIDAGTGLLTIATDAVREAAEVVVTASNSGGSAEIRFRVAITEKAFVPVPPLMLAGPVLVGSAKVGTAMTVETGSWGGDPAPGIACQWLRDGAPIEGAVGTDYLATAEDDLAEIACRVTATNSGGSAEALTAALTVTHVAPVAKGELFEEILDEGTGPQEVPTAQDFEGQNLAFDVAGAGATIDTATGVVSIPTDTPVDGATVTVTATNSGGAAESSFLVTVEAAEPEEPVGPPPPLADDQWQILRSEPSPEIAADSFRPVIAIDASIPVEAAQWTTSGQKPALPEHWETLAPAGEPYTFTTEMLNKDAGDWHVFAEPQGRRANFRIRYRLVADGAWSEETVSREIPLPKTVIIPAPETWEHHTARSAASAAAGRPGGIPRQFMHAADASENTSNIFRFGMDVAGVWDRNPATGHWRHVLNKGIRWQNTASLKIHPTLPNRMLTVLGGSHNDPGLGVYLSNDGGDTNIQVVGRDGGLKNLLGTIPAGSRTINIGGENTTHRQIRHLVDFDRQDTNRAYFFNPYDGMYRCNDVAAADAALWSRVTTSGFAAMKRIFHVRCHPTDGNVIYVAAQTGFYRCDNARATTPTFSKVGGADYPSAHPSWCTSLNVNMRNGNNVLMVVQNSGVYESFDRGNSWAAFKLDGKARTIHVAPSDRKTMFLVRNDNGNNPLFTENGGLSWQEVSVDGGYDGWDGNSWSNNFIHRASPGVYAYYNGRACILFDANDATKAVGASSSALYEWHYPTKTLRHLNEGFSTELSGERNAGGEGSGQIIFHPTNPLRWQTLCADRVYPRTLDGGKTYTKQNDGNVAVPGGPAGGQIGACSPADPDRAIMIVGKYTEFATVQNTNAMWGGQAWFNNGPAATPNNGLNEQWCGAHPTNASVFYSSTRRTMNNGGSWAKFSDISNLPDAARVCGMCRDTGRLFAYQVSGQFIWYSDNEGSGWTKLASGLPRANHHFGNVFHYVTPFFAHPTNRNVFWAGDQGGGIAEFTISGTSYSKTGLGKPSGVPLAHHMTVDSYALRKFGTRILYVVPDTSDKNGVETIVARKIGAGDWEDISYRLPRTQSMRNVIVHPLTGDLFMLGSSGTYILPRPLSVYGTLDSTAQLNASVTKTAALMSQFS